MKKLFTLSAVVFTSAFFLFASFFNPFESAFSQTIAGGGNHSLFVCTDATARTCGLNNYGQLGDGTTTIYKSTPVQVSGLTGITAVAGGGDHSLFVKNDGTAWACGYNVAGQLGDGTTTLYKSTPVQVSGLTGITSVAAGEYHSLFLKNDGSVWACGNNSSGQLGDGTTVDKSTPVQVSGLTGITAVAGGERHSLFVKNDGTVWACGKNWDGQLGDGSGTNKSTPVQVSGLTGITAVAAGEYHSLFLKNDGSVWACGSNAFGELGDGTGIDKWTPVQVSGLTGITSVAAGWVHSLFLKNDGSVWACGYNAYGQLGDGTTTDKSTPVQVSGLTGITAVAGGQWHSLFLKNNGTVWACGYNGTGQLGDGTNTQRLTPVQVTGLCTVAMSLDALQPWDLETISIYPNPASDEITIQMDNVKWLMANGNTSTINHQPLTIEIYNVLGERVLYKEANLTQGHTQVKINVSALAAGNYMFRVTLPNKERTEKIFIR